MQEFGVWVSTVGGIPSCAKVSEFGVKGNLCRTGTQELQGTRLRMPVLAKGF